MTSSRPLQLSFQPQDLCQPLTRIKLNCPELNYTEYEHLGIDVEVLRLDLIDADISGNKWFKLRLNLEQAIQTNQLPVISFGGAFSNHIHALAAAGNRFGFDTVGVIRGEPEYAKNPTLSDAINYGMHLHFVDRKAYRQKTDAKFIDSLFQRYGRGTIIPEGGANILGVKGCEDIAAMIELDTKRKHHVVMPVATGTTFAGVLNGFRQQVGDNPEKSFTLHGIAVLNAGTSIARHVCDWLHRLGERPSDSVDQWVIHSNFDFGGYAQIKAPLVAMMDHVERVYSLPLDPIYTGKMLFGFDQLVKQGDIQPGDRVTLIHTGGLQGVRGCKARLDQLRSTMV